MKPRAVAGALLATVVLVLACSSQEELAAVLLSPYGGRADAGAADAERIPARFVVIGQPLSGRSPFEVAEWPLQTSLRAFFAPEQEEGSGRVIVLGADREPLWQLRRAVAAGEYGRSPNAVTVQDAVGDRYLIVFPGD